MDPNLKYLNENFITLEELADQTGKTPEDIRELIRSKRLPHSSYTLSQTVKIASPLGDNYTFEQEILYFPKSYVALVAEIDNRNAADAKEEFIARMRSHLLNHPSKALAYQNAIAADDELSVALEGEWNAYQDGIYGICTLHATPEEVIEKEIAVKKLLRFIDQNREVTWKDSEEELSNLIDGYDEVSNLFAPYQRESSSRGKYVDRPLKVLGRIDKIKNY